MAADDRDKREPLSSEELIRRARDGLGSQPEHEETPSDPTEDENPRDEVVDEPDPPPPPDEVEEPVEIEEPFEDSWELPPPPPPPPTREGEETWTEPYEPAPTDDPWASPETSLPPRPDWSDGDPAPTVPDGSWNPPPPPQRSGFVRLFSVGRWIIGGIFLAVALGTCFASGETFEDLMIGDCFEDPGLGEVSSVDTIDCNELHDFELYARIDLGTPTQPWPGETALFNEVFDECLGRFAGYVGTEWEFSAYDFDAFIPVEAAWDQGDREGLCVIYEFDGDFNLIKAIGSARNSGR